MLYYAFQNVDSFFLVNEFNKKKKRYLIFTLRSIKHENTINKNPNKRKAFRIKAALFILNR
jgi:hypothetical protein